MNRYRIPLMEAVVDPAAGGAVVPPPAPAPVAAPAPVPGEEFKNMTPEQFKARIAEAQNAGAAKAYKDIGIRDPGEARTRFDELQKLKDAQLSESERNKKTIDELTVKAQGTERLTKIVADRAKVEFERLPKTAQDYIARIAGEDPAARLDAINAAAETGLLAALQPPTAPVVDPAIAQRAANPATTIAPPGPATPPPTGAKTELQQYEDYKARGMTRVAAQHYERYGTLIEQQRAASKTS